MTWRGRQLTPGAIAALACIGAYYSSGQCSPLSTRHVSAMTGGDRRRSCRQLAALGLIVRLELPARTAVARRYVMTARGWDALADLTGWRELALGYGGAA